MKLPLMVVSDLDGTLLPESKVLTEKSAAVLQGLAARGVKIAVASGKFYHLTQSYAHALGPETPVIALDGARTGFSGGNGEVEARGIPRETALALLEKWDAPHLASFADSGEDELLLRLGATQVPSSIQAWASRIRRVEDVGAHLVGDPALLCFYGPEREEMEEIARAGRESFPGLRSAVHTSTAIGVARAIIQMEEITKGSGVLQLCRHFGFEPARCMVFGDWYNDLSMFEVGCVNVAMANAMPEVKARADHVTPLDCENDGVAEFLSTAFP